MSAWCHGAPGIGLSRLRAFELTHNEVYKNESIKSCENTVTSLEQLGNYSLCHGLFGNAETLLFGSSILKDETYLEKVTEKAIEGIERFENKDIPWPCGTMGSVSDPSFMLGESGIGHFLLRLYDNKTESVLSIHSNKKDTNIRKNEKILQKLYLNSYFNETLKIIDAIEKKEDAIIDQMDFSIDQHSDVEKIFELIENYINETNESYTDKLKDLFILEKEKYLSTIEIKDYSKEYLEKLILDVDYQPDWEISKFCLKEDCKLIVQKYNYQNNNSAISVDIKSEQNEKYFLLFADNNKIKVIQVNQFSYVILSSVRNGSSFDNIMKTISDVFEIEHDQTDLLQKKIREQLLSTFKSGLLKIVTVKNGAFV